MTTAATAAAVVYESDAGRLKLTGDDARDLLNRLSTNLVDPEAPAGEVTATVLTSDRGRIVDLAYVVHCGDYQLLLTSAGQQGNVAAFLDKYTIMEDLEVEDVTGATALAAVTGAGAEGIAGAVRDDDAGARVIRLPGEPAAYLMLAAASGGDDLMRQLEAAGAARITAGEAEAIRIARGQPRYGAEMGDAYNPLEAGLIGAIDFHKGCYIGQEVIARLDTYQKVQKHLAALRFEGVGVGDGGDLVGARLVDGAGKAMGVVTSAAALPSGANGDDTDGGGVIGLGYVRTAAAEVGACFGVSDSGGGDTAVVARITGLPLLFGGEKPAANAR